MKATEQYFPVMLFITLYKVVLTLSLDEILKCDHSNESYWAVLSCDTVCYAAQGGFNFCFYGWIQMSVRGDHKTHGLTVIMKRLVLSCQLEWRAFQSHACSYFIIYLP